MKMDEIEDDCEDERKFIFKKGRNWKFNSS